MGFITGRSSDSPYIDSVWHGQSDENYVALCPADEHWNMLFMRINGVWTVDVEGVLTKAKPKFRAEPAEFLVIRFALGVFPSNINLAGILNEAVTLPNASSKTFWLHGGSWQLPSVENAETFVDRLVRDGVLLRDPVVNAVIQDVEPAASERTVRRRFQTATGLTRSTVRQIERARQAVALLSQGASILDAAYEAGYADQPHMTRALKQYFGKTPAQILRVTTP